MATSLVKLSGARKHTSEQFPYKCNSSMEMKKNSAALQQYLMLNPQICMIAHQKVLNVLS